MVETTVSAKRDLRLIRLYYFITIGAGGFLLPFLSLYFRQRGLSGTQIGLLGTVQAIASLVAAPAWGRWDDRLKRPRRLLQAALLGTAVISLILGRQDTFIAIALLVGIDAIITAGLSPMSDILAVNIAERVPGVGFGSIRLWGSMGWTLVTAVAGRIISSFTIYIAFIGYAVGMVWGAISLHFMSEPPSQAAGTPADPVISNRQLIRQIAQNRRLVGLAIALGVSWLLSSGLYPFEAIYMDELGASLTLIGLANALNAIVELPAMLWADKLLNRYTAGWLLRVAFLLLGGRMLAVLLFPSIETLMLMRIVMGVQFSFYSVGIIAYINSYTKKSYRVTTLALFTITLRNLVVMISNPLSGLIYDAAGAYWLYAFGLAGALLGWLALQLSRDGGSEVSEQYD
jgi:MFS family permease